MSSFIALIILIVLIYFFVQEIGFNLSDILYEIGHFIGGSMQSDAVVVVICIVLGSIIAYFLLFRKEK